MKNMISGHTLREGVEGMHIIAWVIKDAFGVVIFQAW